MAGDETVAVSSSPTLRRVIVRIADAADVAALAELQDIEPDNLSAYADWVAAHADAPAVRRRGRSHVTVHSGRPAVDFYLRNGFRHHRQLLLREPAAA